MNYSPEQFIRLTEYVDAIGGEHLDEMCVAREYELTGPVGKEPGKKLMLAGCGNYSIFEVPYESEIAGTNAAVLEKIRLCAVCDDMGRMPRFRV